jgi:hypothetical protein
LDYAAWYFCCAWLISFTGFSIYSMGAALLSRSTGFTSANTDWERFSAPGMVLDVDYAGPK